VTRWFFLARGRAHSDGLAIFEKVVHLQQRYRKPGQQIQNDLQTNGVLLDQAWVDFLKHHGFVVGLSLDGPQELHDRYRYSKGGAPTFDKVMRSARMLAEAGVPYAVLCVVNRDVARQPREVYRFWSNTAAHGASNSRPVLKHASFSSSRLPAYLPVRCRW